MRNSFKGKVYDLDLVLSKLWNNLFPKVLTGLILSARRVVTFILVLGASDLSIFVVVFDIADFVDFLEVLWKQLAMLYHISS